MSIKDIELFDISRYRQQLMGLAMIFIILFHISLPRSDMFFGLRRMGNIGVDIFLFLSGVGLWFSWTKMRQEEQPFLRKWAAFYWRRLKRVYPAWVTVASLYYIPRFIDKPTHSPEQWLDLFGDIAVNWGFWLHDELTFWYIPATMMLYIFAAPYMEMLCRCPVYRWMAVVPVIWCVMVQYVTPIHQSVGHIEIFWSRVPIFFLGINIAESVRRRETIDGRALWLIAFLAVMCLGACIWLEQMRHGKFPLFIERMVYIPLTVSGVLLLAKALCHAPRAFHAATSWVGAISLETYLIHSEFVLRHITPLHLGYWPSFLLTAGISLPLAFLLHRILEKCVR